MQPKIKGEKIHEQTKGFAALIREKYEKVINYKRLRGAGALTLDISGKKLNAKPFLITHSTIMLNFIIILQVELWAHYVMIKT